MFLSTMFGDAICRDIMPNAFPQPVEDAPAKYVSTFLRAVGAQPTDVVLPLNHPELPENRRAAAQ
jgi:hypothetical protein